jgi:hypothetical protein
MSLRPLIEIESDSEHLAVHQGPDVDTLFYNDWHVL